MAGDEAFQVEGRVIAVLPNGTVRVELKNGHRLTGFVAGKTKRRLAGFTTGERVKLQLKPYDLSVGRILLDSKNDLKNESSSVS
ncbi:MAG: translation initiation factor IF-1 [Verrucomicrobiota bacterium]|nr:translation initiation factor IF-1 [Verrucomicrobiota bacterium]